jgi:hypothetical protein
LLSGVLAVADRRRTLVIAFALAIPAVALRWVHHFWPDTVPVTLFLVLGLLLIIFVTANLLRFILRAAVVDLEVICASLSAYLMLGLTWSIAYWFVAELNPNAFSFNTVNGAHEVMKTSNAFYFSFITLCTVGYGDITPFSKVARMLAAMEAVTGMLYIAVLVARLVSLYSVPKSGDSSRNTDD